MKNGAMDIYRSKKKNNDGSVHISMIHYTIGKQDVTYLDSHEKQDI